MNPRPGMTWREWLLLFCVILPGLLGIAVFGYYALVDWAALLGTYARYEKIAHSSADLRAVFIAESDQNIHRINLFADGVWTLLAAILAAIGLHGLRSRSRLD